MSTRVGSARVGRRSISPNYHSPQVGIRESPAQRRKLAYGPVAGSGQLHELAALAERTQVSLVLLCQLKRYSSMPKALRAECAQSGGPYFGRWADRCLYQARPLETEAVGNLRTVTAHFGTSSHGQVGPSENH